MHIARLSSSVPPQKAPQKEAPQPKWETFTRGAAEGALTYGLPALAGAALPGWGKVAGAALGAGLGLLHSQGCDRQTKLRLAAAGAFNGLAAAAIGSFFPVAGTLGMTAAGALITGYYQANN